MGEEFVLFGLLVIVYQMTASQGLECGYPGSPAFGRPHPVRESYTPGSAVSFSCLPGYALQGPLQRLCMENGTWAGPLPLCDRSLSNLEHIASSRETLLSYPAKLSVDGDPDTCAYTDKVKPRWIRIDLQQNRRVTAVALTVPRQRYARDAAELNVFVISVKDSTRASYIKCSSFSGRFATATLKLPCAGGEVEGRYIHVDDGRNLVDYFSLCEVHVFVRKDRYECGEAERPTRSYTVRIESGELEYRCVHGHRLQGTRRRQCLASGQWSDQQPICTETRCPPLEEVDRGRLSYSGRTSDRLGQDTVANVSCDYGFQSEGSERLCQEDGTWSQGDLVCQPVDCGTPLPLNPSEQYLLLNSSTTFGSTALLTCQDGRETVRLCREDATWSPTDLDCSNVAEGMRSTMGLVEEEQNELPIGIVIATSVLLTIALLAIILVFLLRRRKKSDGDNSLPSKDTSATSASVSSTQPPFENEAFYSSIPVEETSAKEPREKSYILFTRKKNPTDASIYEEIGRSIKQKETDAVYAQVDLDEKRRSRLLRSLSIQKSEPEVSYRAEEPFDEVDLEPVRLRELPPLPLPEEDPPLIMQKNDIYEETHMKNNEIYQPTS